MEGWGMLTLWLLWLATIGDPDSPGIHSKSIT
jgi:hypothetical protein